MKVFKINLTGGRSWMVTEKQAESIKQIVKSNTGNSVEIENYGAFFRASAVRDIEPISVKLEDCPKEFRDQWNKENGRLLESESYRTWQLPTEWIVLIPDETSKLVVSNEKEYQLERDRKKYVLAKCHYRTVKDEAGSDEKAYELDIAKIPEVLFMIPDNNNSMKLTRILRYGVEPAEPKLASAF